MTERVTGRVTGHAAGVPPWLEAFYRPYPSANGALIRGERPVLVDSGFGSDSGETARLLRAAGLPPERLSLVVNTHHHSDHVGGNHALQAQFGLPVAAHRWEAAMVNRRDPEACSAVWLDQPVEPYTVNRSLEDGDEIDAGGVVLRVLHTPGHSLGHLALYEPETGVLLCGDAVHEGDVAWLNPFREGAGALERALETLERLMSLRVTWALSGHGPPLAKPQEAFAAARRRYEGWAKAPERAHWHGVKRIFAYALMIRGGLLRGELEPYLLGCPWFHDYSRHAFRLEPVSFVAPLLAEVLRSGAAGWQGERLVALAPHRPPAGWAPQAARPQDWPQ